MAILIIGTFSFHCATDQKSIQSTGMRQEKCDTPVWDVGDSWRYRNDDKKEWEQRIVGTEDFKNTKIYVVSDGFSKRGYDVKTLQYIVDIDPDWRKTVRMTDDSLHYDFPLYVGKKWERMVSGKDTANMPRDYLFKYKVVSFENITVPAGTFKTYKIELTKVCFVTKGDIKMYIWFSPEIKREVKFEYGPGWGFKITGQGYELKSFKLSKVADKTQPQIMPPVISKGPILRIETGMHTSVMSRIGIDSENRYLVTGSFDKTVRVWDLSTGTLIRTLRPPIGEGNEGKIYAVAISPDGKTIACGGWTGLDWEKVVSIYLFDRENGKLIKRISGLPNTIHQLAYSKDGRYLMAGLKGIHIYFVERNSSQISHKLVAEDRDYGDRVGGAEFDEKGKLATTSWDGFIRLYDKDFRLIKKEKAPGGNRPLSLSFSPDGEKIAVGYADSTRVDVLSTRDLSRLYSPDTKSIKTGDLRIALWSSDGQFLYAGGRWYHNGFSFQIRKWRNEGKGTYTDLPGADNTISHIIPLKKGGIAYGATSPAFGVIDPKDDRIIYVTPSIADYRDNREKFLVSDDSSTLQFGYEIGGKSPARFSIKDRLLDSELRVLTSELLLPPLTSSEGINITDWRNNYTPKLNGTPLSLEQYEMSRSLAISPDRKTFLLGAEWNLRLFDMNGREKWKIPVPGAAWCVNISGNGKLAVAAFGDGTIRWFRLEDGKELLAFFPHKDKKRWVIWTPKGYYDTPPGAEDLIGWHINNGMDNVADFFPISRFRPTYYRPDVIAKIIGAADEDKALRLANEESGVAKQEVPIEKMLPPVVRIISPLDGSEVTTTEVPVKFSIRMPSEEPVTGVKALVDGRPIATERGLKIVGKEEVSREIRVAIPEKDSEISILAENRHGVSEPATVRVKWRGKEKKEEFIIMPKLYVLAIGVSQYVDKNLTLRFAAKDARDFAETMKRQKGGLYRDVVVKIVTDQKGTKDEILDGLDWIQRETTSKDIAMLFLAGHGVNDMTGIYYYLPVNADTERLKRTGVPFSDIKNTLSSLAGKTILFVDTCHSGNVMGAKRGIADITAVVNELASAESGVVVFSSSTGKQYSIEDPAWENGAFTKALIEGLIGKADYTGKGKITINMLDLYVSERVKELTKGRQTPTTTKPHTIPDFPIAVKR